MKKLIVYLDGQWIKMQAADLERYSPGVFKAKGVFETILAVGHKVFDLKEHLYRLHRSFKGISVSKKIIHQAVRVNNFALSRVRVVAWQEGKQKHLLVAVLPYSFPRKAIFKVCLLKTDRPANRSLADTKSLDYGLFAESYHQARKLGYDEALLINRQGYIFEASRANIFIIIDGQLLTPPLSSGCLNGITRQKLIKMALQLGLSVKEQNLTPERVRLAPIAFLTNSLMGIKPIQLV